MASVAGGMSDKVIFRPGTRNSSRSATRSGASALRGTRHVSGAMGALSGGVGNISPADAPLITPDATNPAEIRVRTATRRRTKRAIASPLPITPEHYSEQSKPDLAHQKDTFKIACILCDGSLELMSDSKL